jgi:hypothetical protein
MIKGWRNDPRWVAFYAMRDRERIEREIGRLKAETAIAMKNADVDRAVRQLQRPRWASSAGESNW